MTTMMRMVMIRMVIMAIVEVHVVIDGVHQKYGEVRKYGEVLDHGHKVVARGVYQPTTTEDRGTARIKHLHSPYVLHVPKMMMLPIYLLPRVLGRMNHPGVKHMQLIYR